MLIIISKKKGLRHLEGSFYPRKVGIDEVQNFIDREKKTELKNTSEDKLFCEINSEGKD